MSRNIVTLLGAGASVDAGAPTSVGLVNSIQTLLQSDPRLRRIFDFVVAGCSMREAWTQSGQANIEDVANAVSALRYRRTSELAPFVSGWHPFLEGLLSQLPHSEQAVDHLASLLQRQFVLASEGRTDTLHMDWFNFSANVIKCTKEQTPVEPDLVDLAKKLPYLTARALTNSIDRGKTSYLKDLAKLSASIDGSGVIATLNYDNALEYAFDDAFVSYRDGVEYWQNNGEIVSDRNELLLLKLHGSVNWERDNEHRLTRLEPGEVARRPDIVFGGHNKMRADGPYLPLLWAWRSALLEADTLLVVGYSFSDPHINSLIEEWLVRHPRAGSGRIIHIVTYARNEASDLECKLIEARDGMLPSTWAADIRVQVSLGTAKELLGKVISDLVSTP